MQDTTRPQLVLPREVNRHVEELRGLVGRVEPASITPGEAAELWAGFNTMNRLISAAQLRLAARVDESGEWQTAGCRNAAEYMARQTGGSQRSAQDALRASKRLSDCPTVDAALRAGQVSVAQAEIIAAAAVVDPTCESFLLEAAERVPVFRLAEMAGQIRAASDPNPTKAYERIRSQRCFRQRTDVEGAWHLFGHGPADDGALLQHALGPLIDEIFDQGRAEGRHEHRDAYQWDALHELVRRYIEVEDLLPEDDYDDSEGNHSAAATTGDNDNGATTNSDDDSEPAGPEAATGGSSQEDAPGANRTQRRRRSRANRKYLTLVRVDVSGLRNTSDPDGRYVEIPGVGRVPLSAAERLLPESLLYLVLTNGTDVVNITNLSRRATVAQQVKLLWENPRCSNEACGHAITQLDHREPWAQCHRTDTGNLDPLCPHCHRLKTVQGWELVDGTGPRAFVPSSDPRHPKHKAKPDAA